MIHDEMDEPSVDDGDSMGSRLGRSEWTVRLDGSVGGFIQTFNPFNDIIQ